MHHTTRELRLAAALVEAADTLTEGFDTEEYLRRLSDNCAELLSAAAAGVMLLDGAAAVSLAGSSRGEDIALDLLRAQRGGGPCLDSYGTGRPVPPVRIGADARWPERWSRRWPDFTGAALRHGVGTTFAVPLRCRGTRLGALNVFALADAPAPDDAAELSLAQALADAAAVGLQNRRAYTGYRTLSGQLQRALSSRVRIEQAKGMLAERWGTGADEAFTVLRQYARRRRLPLDGVVRSVLERSAEHPELRPPGGEAGGGHG
ncbi:ANTAR domain-containing protein [Streptomyces sp. NPDC046915]|uniref:ANTAR domain-containing protein n=1 Tax=Streptomyces sp. NPDC046915 TaxID=3155257 RepID=UPI0033FA7B33